MMKPIPTDGRAIEAIFMLKPINETIHAVVVVPIFAPMITPIDWVRLRSPALTKDTTITVVAEDDWIIVVTAAPVSTPTNRFLVIKFKALWSRSPAACCIPSLITFIPYKKRHIPPVRRNRIPIYSINVSIAEKAGNL
jgi:hypothetical protein